MKGLFVVFHGFSAHSGISKKIFSQCDALRRNGADVELCHRQTGVAGRHHAPHPRRGRGVPLHPPRPQRQPGADPLAAQSQKTRRTHRARNTDLPLRRRIRAITLRAQAETAHRPHLPPPDGPLGGPHRDLLRRPRNLRPADNPHLQRHRLPEHPAQDAAARQPPRNQAAGRGEHSLLARSGPRDRGPESLLRRSPPMHHPPAHRGRRHRVAHRRLPPK